MPKRRYTSIGIRPSTLFLLNELRKQTDKPEQGYDSLVLDLIEYLITKENITLPTYNPPALK